MSGKRIKKKLVRMDAEQHKVIKAAAKKASTFEIVTMRILVAADHSFGVSVCCIWRANRMERKKPLSSLHHREYVVWAAMRNRCYNVNNGSYRHYGGRGINGLREMEKKF